MTAHRHFIPHDDVPHIPRRRSVSLWGAGGLLLMTIGAGTVLAGIVRLVVEFWP